MAKNNEHTLSSDSLYLEIYSFIRIWAPRLPSEIYAFLGEQLHEFKSDKAPPHTVVEILVREMQKKPPLSMTAVHMEAIHDFCLMDYEGENAVAFLYKGSIDIIIVFTDTIKIYYRYRINQANRIYGVLLFVIRLLLEKQNVLLCHGTVVEKLGKTLLIAGPRGVRKSQLLFMMLRHGWNYLSDDKFLFHNKQALLFQSFITLRDHHFQALPWLNDRVPSHLSPGNKAEYRNKFQALARRHIHKKLLPAADHFLNPALRLHVHDLFPESEIVTSAQVTSTVIINTGAARINMTTLSRNEAVDTFITLQELAFADYCRLQLFLELHQLMDRKILRTNSTANLKGQKYFKIEHPADCDINELYKEVLVSIE